MSYDPSALESLGEETATLYIDSLHYQGIIDERIFAIALQGYYDTSFMDVGFYDVNAYSGNIAWLYVIDDYYYG